MGVLTMTFSRLILAAGLAIGAALLAVTSGATAQSLVIQGGGYRDDGYGQGGYGDNTVVVRRHHDNGWHHGWDRRYSNRRWQDREVYGTMNRCRVVTIRRENEMGDIIVKRVRRCN